MFAQIPSNAAGLFGRSATEVETFEVKPNGETLKEAIRRIAKQTAADVAPALTRKIEAFNAQAEKASDQTEEAAPLTWQEKEKAERLAFWKGAEVENAEENQ